MTYKGTHTHIHTKICFCSKATRENSEEIKKKCSRKEWWNKCGKGSNFPRHQPKGSVVQAVFLQTKNKKIKTRTEKRLLKCCCWHSICHSEAALALALQSSLPGLFMDQSVSLFEPLIPSEYHTYSGLGMTLLPTDCKTYLNKHEHNWMWWKSSINECQRV